MNSAELEPSAELRAELAQRIAEAGDLSRMLLPPADGGVRRVVRPSSSPFFLVEIPVAARPGKLWVSRLPGNHLASPEPDLVALESFGIDVIFCLLPATTPAGDARVAEYQRVARARFGNKFVLLQINNHDVPPDDAAFEQAVERAELALASGQSVLVHCLGGCGRSGLFVASVLTRTGLSAVQAIEHFRRHRGCGPETLEQLAFVLRYEAKRTVVLAPRVNLSRGADGPKRLARGGLASIYVGRVRLPSGRVHRVAIKDFSYAVTDADAQRLTATITALRAGGVRLPRMFMHRLDSRWVQVSQLFGSTERGSKLGQPMLFYQDLAPEDRLFVADQLARVASLGYMPTIDLFLVFEKPRRGVIPFDLDLVVPEPKIERRAMELLKRLLHVAPTRTDLSRVLEAAYAASSMGLDVAVREMLASEHPMARLWRTWSGNLPD